MEPLYPAGAGQTLPGGSPLCSRPPTPVQRPVRRPRRKCNLCTDPLTRSAPCLAASAKLRAPEDFCAEEGANRWGGGGVARGRGPQGSLSRGPRLRKWPSPLLWLHLSPTVAGGLRPRLTLVQA